MLGLFSLLVCREKKREPLEMIVAVSLRFCVHAAAVGNENVLVVVGKESQKGRKSLKRARRSRMESLLGQGSNRLWCVEEASMFNSTTTFND